MKAVARIFHFPPSELSLLYLDEKDHLGLEFWYLDAVAYSEEVTKAASGK